MCGRFAQHSTIKEIAEALRATSIKIREDRATTARYNIAPLQDVIAARESEEGERELVSLRWGLVPAWAKDPSVGARMINARAETAAEKPAYRSALRHRRILIPSSGFYEWAAPVGGRKQPFYFRMRDNNPFALAGLWERWEGEGGKAIESCTILTTEANEILARVHERMPVVVAPGSYDEWLDPKVTKAEELKDILRPYPAERMESHPVGFGINNPRSEGESLVAPLINSR